MMDHKLVEKRAHRWFEIEKGLEILPAEPNPGQSVSCGLNFVSNFPVGIEVKLRLCCKQTGRFFNSGPRFRVDLHEDGARVTCPGSHNFLAPRSSEPLPQDCPTGGFCCQTLLEPGVNRVELLTKTGEVGSFITDHLHVVINSFGLEIEIPERFQVLFHVRTELPSAELVRIKSPLYGGIVQKLRLVACPGSVGTNRETVVQLSSDESHLLFRRTSEQAWSDQMDVTVPILDSNSVFNCVLDGLMVLKGLRDATLVSAKPIHPEGEYKFVWILSSDSGASHYVVTMNYRFSTEKDSEEYAYVDPVSFDTSKAVYELCCQITSRPLLCRAESQCDLVISLRSLHPERRAESLVIGLEANPTQWHLMEQQKVVSVKESGLGQVTFGVVPRSVGYLPLPSVVLLRKNDDSGNHCLPLKVYVRTEGKQVHVLAPLPKGKGSTSASAPHLPLEF